MNIEANEDKESLDMDRGAKDENVVGATELEPPGEVQMQHQPSQGTVVCWERFLHLRSIRVLLVENDHSTRHVVSALLRNCNYEVLNAANGLQAWKILQDLTNHIDLVLTEVIMPDLSGIALLCKIMSHKTRKNIPVVMMSSNDSMGLVVMCLSKGAVDFLVKPIRKNELKNLWQHVWRRCHSSSGSGSESGTQTQKYVKSKCSENGESNDGENDVSNGLTVGDGSDDGSGAQSSWTKQAVEVESSQAMSPMHQAAEFQDSTCAQVIRSNAETSGTKWMHICESGGGHVQKPPDTAEDKNLKINIPKDWESQCDFPVKVPLTLTGPNLKSLSEINCNTSIKQVAEGQPTPISECLFSLTGPNLKSLSEINCNTSIKQVAEGQPTPISECLFEKHESDCENTSMPLVDVRETESTIEVTNILNLVNNGTDDLKEPKSELSLKRHRGVKDTGRSVQNDRYVLRRSEQSAFSRYNTSSTFLKAADGITGSSSMIGNSIEVAKKESVADVQALLTDYLVYQDSNGVGDNIDMGFTTKLITQPSMRKDTSEATSTINGLHPSAFKPVKNDLRFSQQRDNLLLQGCSSKEFEIQHPHHEKYYHHNHHFHDLEEKPSSNIDDSALKKSASLDPDFGSSSVLGGHKNYSLNGSASGSNRVSNRQNGINTAINTPENNVESDVGQAGKSGSGDASNTGGGGNRMDENKLVQREVALNKFRQKRKERCFTKKVRYQNRKKLAEQRPRVRGQFVKKTGHDCSKNC